jgi:D-glycero-alpha-D-manno-heptose-7-phosphate kinase
MIISRTPFRISFVGGGTDLESYYSQNDGKVLSTTIDKYIYVCVKKPVDIVEHKYRIAWSQLEYKDNIDDIEHPIVRETLKFLKIEHPIEIVTFADVPAQTGLGSSSAFAVGLLQALYALRGEVATKYQLASEAAHIEIERLGRHIGKQDHFAAAYGNLNIFSFHQGGKVSVDPVFYNPSTKRHVENRLMLFYTALKRDASKVLKEQRDSTEAKRTVLDSMRDLVEPLRDVLMHGEDPARFGAILDESWQMKRSLTGCVSSSEIDRYYEAARSAGALGGKLLGAGGGGFLLLYVEPEHQPNVRKALEPLYQLQFRFDDGGSRITYYDER